MPRRARVFSPAAGNTRSAMATAMSTRGKWSNAAARRPRADTTRHGSVFACGSCGSIRSARIALTRQAKYTTSARLRIIPSFD
jgi:hypothetical protein